VEWFALALQSSVWMKLSSISKAIFRLEFWANRTFSDWLTSKMITAGTVDDVTNEFNPERRLPMRKRRPRKRNGNNEQLQAIRLWTQPEITKAFPYMRSITQGLREHWLTAAAHGVRAARLAKKHGRPDRGTLIALDEAHREQEHALGRFEDTLEELNGLDVFCIDPIKGIVWVPFRSGDDLAWYIFDAFDAEGLIGWRLHGDTVETIRALGDETNPTAPDRHVA